MSQRPGSATPPVGAQAGDVDPLSRIATDASRSDAEQSRIDHPTPASPPVRHVARLGRDYEHSVNLFNAALFRRYRRTSSDPLYRPLRVFLTDPVKSSYAGGVTTVAVPYEELGAGPTGSYLAVAAGGRIRGEPTGMADLDCRAAALSQGFRPSTADPAFHQQMVYAVCAEVAAVFTGALGRELSWGFDNGVLKLRPHFGEERNAYYDPEHGELRFGYFAADKASDADVLPGGTVYTCLSHDVIAHEMTHAILDGMRTRFHEPTNPDVLAFHEGFSDLVAILLHFTRADAVEATIARSAGQLGTDRTIFALAAEFGSATGMHGPLRILLGTPEAEHAMYGGSEEPHARGMVMVSAILDAFSRVFERRAAATKLLIAAYPPQTSLHPVGITMLAQLASRTAAQFLALCIRAIDYCPPVDIRFGEYLRALVTADHDLIEDDRDGFRQELIGAFARRGIYPDDVPDISEDALLWRGPDLGNGALPEISELGFAALQLEPDPGESPSKDEIAREAGALADVVTDPRFRAVFGLSDSMGASLPTVASIRILRRVGPDRQVRFGLVCEVLQDVVLERDGVSLRMTGGSTVIMDSAGTIRFVIRKRADQPERVVEHLRFKASDIGVSQRRAYEDRRTWATLCGTQPAC